MMTKLVEYCLAYLVGDADANLSPPIALLRKVVENTANLAASYMAAGFVHGVLNSDNINLTGQSFDYGPSRFTPRWETGFPDAHFAQQGLYSSGRQAESIQSDTPTPAVT